MLSSDLVEGLGNHTDANTIRGSNPNDVNSEYGAILYILTHCCIPVFDSTLHTQHRILPGSPQKDIKPSIKQVVFVTSKNQKACITEIPKYFIDMFRCGVVCCSVLRCVAVNCVPTDSHNALQRRAVCCSAF